MTDEHKELIRRATHIIENGGVLARDTSLLLIAALEAKPLPGKPPEQYSDDDELLHTIDIYDEVGMSLQIAMWLKELRRRREGTV